MERPILKIIEKQTQIPMDITFNIIDGYQAVNPIKQLMKKYPPLKPLALVIKAFLRERKLNETYKGGVGSFLLVILVVAFLQFERKELEDDFYKKTLGELLILFFKFYGSDFNYTDLGISVIGDGMFIQKPSGHMGLYVENPQNAEQNLASGARRFTEIVKTFNNAYDLLRYSSATIGEIIHTVKDREDNEDD